MIINLTFRNFDGMHDMQANIYMQQINRMREEILCAFISHRLVYRFTVPLAFSRTENLFDELKTLWHHFIKNIFPPSFNRKIVINTNFQR